MSSIVLRGIATVGLLVAYSNAVAQLNVAADQRPRPSVVATELADKPDLDGMVVGDFAWEGVTPTSGFTQIQPNEGRDATQKTEVFIAYTNTALYIGVMAYDDDPSTIIVADSRRDSSLD